MFGWLPVENGVLSNSSTSFWGYLVESVSVSVGFVRSIGCSGYREGGVGCGCSMVSCLMLTHWP